MARCWTNSPPRWTLLTTGALVGFVICVKPHFALIAGGTEAYLLLFRRHQCQFYPLVAFLLSGLFQVLIFVFLFDIYAYRDALGLFDYYDTVGMHYSDVVGTLIASPIVLSCVIACAASLFLIARNTAFHIYAEACAVTILFGLLLTVLQGTYRPYYLLQFFLPTASVLLLTLLQTPNQFVGGTEMLRRLFFVTSILASIVGLWMLVNRVGIVDLARLRYFHGLRFQVFGGMGPDPFVEYVKKRLPKNAVIWACGPYGQPYFDPISSMVRLGRPLPSHYPGLELGIAFAMKSGDAKKLQKAIHQLHDDIESSRVNWVFFRHRANKNPIEILSPPQKFLDWDNDPVKVLQSDQSFWDWFNANFKEADRFDHYIVFQRKTASM